jgi:hypothetical protein
VEIVMRTDMIEIVWAAPLEVQLQSGLNRIFRSVTDARWFLENEWPIHHGNHYERALMFCRAAEHRQVSAEVAREAFLAACLEAGLALEKPSLKAWRRPSPESIHAFAPQLP